MVTPDKKRARTIALAAAAGAGVGVGETAKDADVVTIGRHPISRFYLRCHISLLILWSFCCGLLITKALLAAGVDSMLIRYPLALLASYGAFFVGIRLWLAYVGAEPLWSGRGSWFGNGSSVNSGGGSWSGGFSSPGSGSVSDAAAGLRGGGGDFSGAGATSSFSDAANAAPRVSMGSLSPSSLFSSHGGSGGGGGPLDLDLGDDGWMVIVLLVVAALLLSSVFGAVLYLIWSAPSVLADVAFQAMLAGGLIKSAQRWRDACWETRLLRATWIPFAIVLMLACVTAGLAAHLFPDAHTARDVILAIRNHLG